MKLREFSITIALAQPGGFMRNVRRAAVAVIALCSAAAHAEKNIVCQVRQVMHTRYGVLVNCKDVVPDPITGGVENINFFAPDARLQKNGNGLAPQLSVAETMRGFEEVALEALRTQLPLIVTFTAGDRPGGLFDCLNQNCRLARAWSVSR